MSTLVSICIPTYNRTDMLREAVQSCLAQTHPPYEILIGDDSSTNETKEWVHSELSHESVKIRYFHNRPSLKQAANINRLFDLATGEVMMLLHDDDTLLPNALEDLSTCFADHPTIDAAFGKQYIMSNEGIVDPVASEGLNKSYYRTAQHEGIKLSALEAGFLQQFPNDGYMIRADLAKKMKYTPEAGDACDFDFGFRLGKHNHNLFFLNKYTACYRLSDDGVFKRPNNAALFSYRLVKSIIPSEGSAANKDTWLKNTAPVAVANATSLKHTREALQIYFSKWHRSKIFTLGGIKRLLQILLSIVK